MNISILKKVVQAIPGKNIPTNNLRATTKVR
jgi:hypothetical protein